MKGVEAVAAGTWLCPGQPFQEAAEGGGAAKRGVAGWRELRDRNKTKPGKGVKFLNIWH